MSVKTKLNHESSINADSVYTGYKWTLNDWVALYDYHYKQSVSSPEIQFMHAKECKCVLTFWPPGAPNSTAVPTVQIRFLSKVEFHSLRARISFVDKKMNKLLSTSPKSIDSNSLCVTLYFFRDINQLSTECLRDGALILFLEMTVVKTVNVSPVSTSISMFNSSNITHDKFESMFEKKKFCDITFIIEGQTLSAHKFVLAAKSAAFEAMFDTDMQEKKEGTVKIDDVDREVFNRFLKYMYTEKVDGIETVVTELIVVADKYQVMDLVNLCEAYMMDNLQLSNVTQYLLTAYRLHRLPLEKKAIQFIKRNTQVLDDPAGYKLLSDYPALLSQIR